LRVVETLIIAAAPLVGVVLTLIYTNRREEARLRQERFFKFREDRKHLYEALAKETEYLGIEDEHRNRMVDLYNEIQLLTEDKNLILAASRLIAAWEIASTQQSKQLESEQHSIPYTAPGAESALRSVEKLQEDRTRFIQIARTELSHSADLDAIKAEREPQASVEGTQRAGEKRSWWSRLFGPA
jgi:hypothetical protein